MGLFSWFKKKQIQAETPTYVAGVDPYANDTSSEVTIFKLGRNDHEADKDFFHEEEEVKFKIKAILSNKTLTVFLPSGDILSNNNASRDMFNLVQAATNESSIKKIMLIEEMLPSERKEFENLLDDEDLQEGLPEIVGTGEFYEERGALFMNGIEVSIPRLLAKEILKAGEKTTDEYYQSLKNFWCWCVLNPDPIAREDIFGFLERGDFKITKNGFFLGYRNVVKLDNKASQSKELVEFISSKYLNIKTKQKKSPKNFEVWQSSEGGYQIKKVGEVAENTKGEVGNLADLYNGLGDMEENNYTDGYTGTMKIKIGESVRMPREACDNDPYADCSRGLHIGNKKFGYQSFGNTTILVAVNPMNVVAVPNRNADKMRVCEYMPLAVINNQKDWLEDADTLELEGEYASEEVDKLQERAKNAGKKEDKEIKLVPGGTLTLVQVASKLESYKEAIDKRVVEVK